MPTSSPPKRTDLESASDGWQLDHSYATLPEVFFVRMPPVPVSGPKVVIVNHALANALGLGIDRLSPEAQAHLFAGNLLPEGAEPLAQAYAGHQYGHFTILGDGRAHLLGEHLTPDGTRVDIQLKGSGKTPFGRRGDGRAALGPMLREYIISEAMHALGIPTTRSLAVVTTGEPVYRDTPLPGAILTRVAASHLRVGTVEYAAAQQNIPHLKQLADYAIARHYPEASEAEQPYQALIQAVMDRQIDLIVDWLRVGFIHGVMNTDNMTLSGETIDYGPCAFMDSYDPGTVFSSIDRHGRYAFGNQAPIAQWNLARLAESLLPLLHEEIEEAASLAEEMITAFRPAFERAWHAMMKRKLGLFEDEEGDAELIADLLRWMQRHSADYTNSFRALISETRPEGALYADDAFDQWWQRWQARLQRQRKPLKSSFCLMRANNPAIIPRNHRVEAALSAAEQEGNLEPLHQLLEALAQPYDDTPADSTFTQPPNPSERVYQTFCGT